MGGHAGAGQVSGPAAWKEVWQCGQRRWSEVSVLSEGEGRLGGGVQSPTAPSPHPQWLVERDIHRAMKCRDQRFGGRGRVAAPAAKPKETWRRSSGLLTPDPGKAPPSPWCTAACHCQHALSAWISKIIVGTEYGKLIIRGGLSLHDSPQGSREPSC